MVIFCYTVLKAAKVTTHDAAFVTAFFTTQTMHAMIHVIVVPWISRVYLICTRAKYILKREEGFKLTTAMYPRISREFQ